MYVSYSSKMSHWVASCCALCLSWSSLRNYDQRHDISFVVAVFLGFGKGIPYGGVNIEVTVMMPIWIAILTTHKGD